jgi:solute carrier family 45 protein 1/2/4
MKEGETSNIEEFEITNTLDTQEFQYFQNELENSSVVDVDDEKKGLKDLQEDCTPNKISIFRLILATICFAGIQFGWALQISLLTPFTLELGLPKPLVTIVWLCGPVAGLVVQPLVGAISDQCTSPLGKRRPFILSGGLLVILSLLLIPNSLDIGSLFGDTPQRHPVALSLTVAGFWLLDISNNMLQGPCRALVADIAAPEQQETGNAIFTFWLGVGNITGFIAGWMPWSSWITFMGTKSCKIACQDLRISFILSTVFLISTLILTLLAANEVPLEKKPSDESSPSRINPIIHLFRVLFRLPKEMLRICLVQFFNWFAWFTFLIYITVWVAENVFNGNPDEFSPNYHLFEEGVRYGSFGLAGFAACSLLFSPFVPRLSLKLGPKLTFFAAQLILSLCLGFTLVVTNKYVAIILISFFGIPWSVTNTIPFALTANVAPKDEKGIYMGILNIFVVVPQLIMSGLGTLISYIFNGNVAATLATGSISAFISCFFIFLLIVPENQHEKSKKTRRRRRRKPKVPSEPSPIPV